MFETVSAVDPKCKISLMPIGSTRFFYKQHFYKQRQAEIDKKSSNW